jgi:hypothetical protein
MKTLVALLADRRIGPRQVKWLSRIEAKRLPE